MRAPDITHLPDTHMTVTVRASKRFRLRMWLAIKILELGCIVMPCSGSVEVE